MIRRLGRWATISTALIMAFGTTAVGAAQQNQRYDVYIGGIKAGGMRVQGTTEGGRYAAQASVKGGGLIGAFVTFGFTGSSQGGVTQSGALVPVSYSSKSETRKRTRNTTIAYARGVPTSINTTPARTPKPYDANPANQKGAMDPIAATYSLLGDAPVGQACGRTLAIFDGSKQSQITIAARAQSGDGWACRGTYRRVQGWSDKDLAERTDFPFTLFYREVNGQMQVTKFQTQSLYGQVVAVRR